MLYYDRINVSEGIDINKASKSKECEICHYWYFLNKGFKFQTTFCNGCHYLLIMSMNPCNVDILNIKGSDCRCIISGISKIETIKLQNTSITEKSGTIQNIKIYFCILYNW